MRKSLLCLIGIAALIAICSRYAPALPFIGYLDLPAISAPSSPATGFSRIYTSTSDSLPHAKYSDGTDTPWGSGATSTNYRVLRVGVCASNYSSATAVDFQTIVNASMQCGAAGSQEQAYSAMNTPNSSAGDFFIGQLVGWNGSTAIKFTMLSGSIDTTAGHTSIYNISGGCMKAGTATVSYASSQSLTITTTATAGSLLTNNISSLSTNSCAATDMWHVKVALTNSGTASPADGIVFGASLQY